MASVGELPSLSRNPTSSGGSVLCLALGRLRPEMPTHTLHASAHKTGFGVLTHQPHCDLPRPYRVCRKGIWSGSLPSEAQRESKLQNAS